MHDLTICIPTKGRLKQKTWKMLHAAGLGPITYFVCEPEDAARLRQQRASLPDAQFMECGVQGIHRVRQWIVDNCQSPYVMMLDDDMEFFRRKGDGDWHLKKCNSVDLRHMLLEVRTLLSIDGYPLVGISARQGNNRQEANVVFNTRMNNAYAMDVEILRHHGIRWDRLPLMEDFDVTLQLLRLGYDNAVLYEYAWNQNGGSNAQGGCSGYRTNAMQTMCAEKLKELHPEFVRIVTKKAKAGWKGMEERKDVVIQWKKALASAGGR
jgi:hypothetical protein